MPPSTPRLPPDQLFRACDPADLPFGTTAELADLAEPVGQERAVAAIRFGVGMEREGYNLFVLGPSGSGKRTLLEQILGYILYLSYRCMRYLQ
jgi:DNA replication protein DnaC